MPQCPKCQREVNPRASVCPACQVELAQCAWCRDLTTLVADGKPGGSLRRQRYLCEKCQHPGVRCRTALWGGYCNGLARASERLGSQLCAGCSATLVDAAKTVAAWTLIGVVSSRLRPKG